jgi:myo-inositol catabolism protein IolC
VTTVRVAPTVPFCRGVVVALPLAITVTEWMPPVECTADVGTVSAFAVCAVTIVTAAHAPLRRPVGQPVKPIVTA